MLCLMCILLSKIWIEGNGMMYLPFTKCILAKGCRPPIRRGHLTLILTQIYITICLSHIGTSSPPNFTFHFQKNLRKQMLRCLPSLGTKPWVLEKWTMMCLAWGCGRKESYFMFILHLRIFLRGWSNNRGSKGWFIVRGTW